MSASPPEPPALAASTEETRQRSLSRSDVEVDAGPKGREGPKFVSYAEAQEKANKVQAVQVLRYQSVSVLLEFKGWFQGDWTAKMSELVETSVFEVLSSGAAHKGHGSKSDKYKIDHLEQQHVVAQDVNSIRQNGDTKNGMAMTVTIEIPSEHFNESALPKHRGCCAGDAEVTRPQRIADHVDAQVDKVVHAFRYKDGRAVHDALHNAFRKAEGIPDLSHKVGPHAKNIAIIPGEDVPSSPNANDQQFVQYPIISTPFGWHIASAESMQHGFYKIGVFSLIGCLISVAVGLVGAANDTEMMQRGGFGAAAAFLGLVFLSALSIWLSDLMLPHKSDREEVLYKFGTGAVLYFKGLKFLSSLFITLGILAVPALLCFVSGTAFKDGEFSSVEVFTYGTLGSLGELSPSCDVNFEPDAFVTGASSTAPKIPRVTSMRNATGKALKLQCPSKVSKIVAVDVVWGPQTQGFCGCPDFLRPQKGSCEHVNNEYSSITTDPVLGQTCCSDEYLDFNGNRVGIGPATSSSVFDAKAASCYTHAKQNASVEDAVRDLCVGKSSCEFSVGSMPQGAASSQNLLRNRPDFLVNETCQQEFKKMQAIATFSCYEDRIFFGESRWWDVSKQDAAWIITLSDLLGCTIFLFMVLWLGAKEDSEADKIDQKTISCEDYTLRLKYVPPLPQINKRALSDVGHPEQDVHINSKMSTEQLAKLTEEYEKSKQQLDDELFEHIEEVIGSSDKVWENRNKGKGVLQSMTSGSAQKKQLKVVEINYGLNSASILGLQRKWRAAEAQLNELETKMEASHEHKTNPYAKKNLDKCRARIAHCVHQIQLLFTQMSKLKPKTAFVTFEDEQGARVALSKFRTQCHCCCYSGYQKKNARFTKREQDFKMIFEEAPPPSLILWENCHVSIMQRVLRRTFATLIVAVCLVLSGIAIVYAKNYKMELDRTYPPVVCEADGDYTLASIGEMMEKRNCPNPDTSKYPSWDDWKTSADFSCSTCARVGAIECYCKPLFTKGVLNSKEEFVMSKNLTHSKACRDESEGKEKKDVVADTSGGIYTETQGLPLELNLCTQWNEDYLRILGMTIASVLVVLVVNSVLDILMFKLSDFEKHFTESTRMKSTAVKIFFAQIMNTCFIVLFVNMNLDLFSPDVLPSIFNGSFADMSVGWYRSVGAPIVLTMILNCFIPHISILLKIPIRKYKLMMDRRHNCISCSDPHYTKKMSQQAFEALYMGPSALLERRYGQIMNIVFMTMIFSGPMPILLPIAGFNFFMIYWVDKICFLRLYRCDTLPADAALSRLLRGFMPLALLMHLAVATWAYSNTDILHKGMEAYSSGIGTVQDLENLQACHDETNLVGAIFCTILFNRLGSCLSSTILWFLMFIFVAAGLLFRRTLWKFLSKFTSVMTHVVTLGLFSTKSEGNPPFHRVLPNARLHDIKEDDALPKRRQQLAQDELDKRDREEVQFDPSRQLGAQMLHSYAVHVNPQYEGITLDLAILAEELDHFESSMSPEEFEKLVAKGAGISRVAKRSTKRSSIKASPVATPSAVTAQDEPEPQESEV